MQVVQIGPSGFAGENAVRDELAEWVGKLHIAGVALFQPNLGAGKECDLLVICPGGVVVIEVKGLRSHASRLITTEPNAAWTCGGQPLDLYLKPDPKTADGAGINPLKQTTNYCTSIRKLLEDETGATGLWVHGLVVLASMNRWQQHPVRVGDHGIVDVNTTDHGSRHNAGRAPALLSVTTLTAGRDRTALRRYFHRLNKTPGAGCGWSTVRADRAGGGRVRHTSLARGGVPGTGSGAGHSHPYCVAVFAARACRRRGYEPNYGTSAVARPPAETWLTSDTGT